MYDIYKTKTFRAYCAHIGWTFVNIYVGYLHVCYIDILILIYTRTYIIRTRCCRRNIIMMTRQNRTFNRFIIFVISYMVNAI